ncbi:MAG: diguanylate cyclase [Sporomusaceae bacterium]|nr:diguanylate cyclase [Sporomusaceae bacterium]
MEVSDLEKRIAALERENRILKKKVERGEANRVLLEEANASHMAVLKVRNAEIEESRELIRQSEARYKDLALYDALTRLPSRVLFQEYLNRAIARAEKEHCLVALLFIDLDWFKAVNDHGGHAAGDAVLAETGQRLLACIKDEGIVARIGGDEFVVLLEQVVSRAAAVQLAEKILAAMGEPFRVRGESLVIGASIGISIYPFHGENIDTLLKNADAAMYGVKRRGRNGWGFYRNQAD